MEEDMEIDEPPEFFGMKSKQSSLGFAEDIQFFT
jgi:hypothetical protein